MINRALVRAILVTIICLAVLPVAGCAKPNATQMADGMVDSMAKGDFASATKDFNATMNAAMSAETLGQTWAKLQEQAGAFKSRTGERETQEAGFQMVYVTCQFEKTILDIKVVFDKDDKIGGLWFVPHTASAQPASPADLASTRALIDAIYKGDASSIESQVGGALQRDSRIWVPAASKALRKQFGTARDISLESSGTPAKGWVERIWSIHAEHGNYQMHVAYLSGKIRHLEFRIASSQPWTPVAAIAQGKAIH